MMKDLIWNRFLPAFLCMALALSLTACGGKNDGIGEYQTDGATGTLSGTKGGTDNTEGPSSEGGDAQSTPTPTPAPPSAPVAGSEEGAKSLALLRSSMTYSDQIAGAVTYLGYWEQGASGTMADWLRANCSGLVEALPFLLEIPSERILGGVCGELYCIVPRDEDTSLAVNHVTWSSVGNDRQPVVDEVLYREESAQPVLVIVDFEEWYEEPDTQIVLVTNDGVEVTWCPLSDFYGNPIVPTGEGDIPMLMDFSIWGYTTGLDYPEGWDPSEGGEPPGDCWPLPPTDWGLADTSWSYGNWMMDLNWGDSAWGGSASPGYSGSVELYYHEDGQAYELAYVGDWRMEDDCLRLELFDGAIYSVEGNFPVLIDPSGELLHMEQDRETGVCPPFFGEGDSCVDLMLLYG